MKMNKIVLALMMSAGVASHAFAANENGGEKGELAPPVVTGNQGSGKIFFKGSVIDAPCSIKDGGEINVSMQNIANSKLKNGGRSSPTPFSIQLQDCDLSSARKTIGVSFSGNTAMAEDKTPINNLLYLDNKDVKAGLGIDFGNKEIVFGAASGEEGTVTIPLNSTSQSIDFNAYLKGLGDAVVQPGDFGAIATFTMNYQ